MGNFVMAVNDGMLVVLFKVLCTRNVKYVKHTSNKALYNLDF